RVDDADVVPHQCNRQAAQKILESLALRGRGAFERRIVLEVLLMAFIKKPARTVLDVIDQQVNFMIAQYAAGVARLDQLLNELDHAVAVRAAVDEVADEDELALLRMPPLGVIAQLLQQADQGGEFSVDVADDVQRVVGKLLN